MFFVLRQRPRTSLQCFALEHSLYKAKHCRDVLGRCLRTKNKIQNQSLRFFFVPLWFHEIFQTFSKWTKLLFFLILTLFRTMIFYLCNYCFWHFIREENEVISKEKEVFKRGSKTQDKIKRKCKTVKSLDKASLLTMNLLKYFCHRKVKRNIVRFSSKIMCYISFNCI